MKLILSILTILTLTQAHATGKLSLQNNVYNSGQTYRPALGFSMYEPFFKRFASNTFLGYGNMPLEAKSDVNWFVAKTQLDIYVGKWTIAPGVQAKYIAPYKETELMEFVKIDMRLW